MASGRRFEDFLGPAVDAFWVAVLDGFKRPGRDVLKFASVSVDHDPRNHRSIWHVESRHSGSRFDLSISVEPGLVGSIQWYMQGILIPEPSLLRYKLTPQTEVSHIVGQARVGVEKAIRVVVADMDADFDEQVAANDEAVSLGQRSASLDRVVSSYLGRS